ncbi:hypothetical protein [Polyangium jinanense]|uniref:Uncharacterized protein n=1 Tax=Polyangium jinanense TaxID=2829994 RepID=A0A9X4ASF7_9BACT|nr:hypothetical protein [Polyangium jinanense]MDC3983074.1 hypothetical protein [Polyangium jinanense]
MKCSQKPAILLAASVGIVVALGGRVVTGEPIEENPDASESARAPAADACAHPRPIFGRVVAVCGDQMITYVGDEKLTILGVPTTTSRFELAYCSTGGGRKPLYLETNSEGFTLSYAGTGERDSYTVDHTWGAFRMVGVDYDGNPVNVPCVPSQNPGANAPLMYR